jgi:hypothetical protein
MKNLLLALPIALASLATACAPGSNCLDHSNCKDDGADEAAAAAAAAAKAAQGAPMCVTGGRAHIGLGGEDVAAKIDGPTGGDRARIKPFSALPSEYKRVLGSTPSSASGAGPTFGIAQDRWYLEPIASAVFVNKAFDVAFEGCSDLVENDSKLSVAPTKESAHDACTTWARRFWSRDATPDQIDACVSAAMDGTDRPWAYACASVLTATGFLTY